jgi:hypothetical protein
MANVTDSGAPDRDKGIALEEVTVPATVRVKVPGAKRAKMSTVSISYEFRPTVRE